MRTQPQWQVADNMETVQTGLPRAMSESGRRGA